MTWKKSQTKPHALIKDKMVSSPGNTSQSLGVFGRVHRGRRPSIWVFARSGSPFCPAACSVSGCKTHAVAVGTSAHWIFSTVFWRGLPAFVSICPSWVCRSVQAPIEQSWVCHGFCYIAPCFSLAPTWGWQAVQEDRSVPSSMSARLVTTTQSWLSVGSWTRHLVSWQLPDPVQSHWGSAMSQYFWTGLGNS